MMQAVSRHVAIWLDRQQAILLSFEADPFDKSVPHRPGDGWSRCRIHAREYDELQQYYDALICHLEPADEILILGPGQAKHGLCHRIEQHRGVGRIVLCWHVPLTEL